MANPQDFSIHNLPWGIFSFAGGSPRVGVAYHDQIIDLSELAELGLFDFDTSVFYENHLNPFMALGKATTMRARTQVQGWLKEQGNPLEDYPRCFIPQAEATMHMPIRVGDYTDFYSSIEHATNVGKLFRDPENALLPNWRHLPVGYHGRASSIIVSGVNIHRPKGQVKPNHLDAPVFQPSTRLDFELEMGFVIGKESELGHPISTEEAENYIFGLILFNDWSARDIQKWEYVPLGPFLGKNFASSVAPWIVPLEALEPFRIPGPQQDPEVLDYLQCSGDHNYDVQLEVTLTPEGGEPNIISQSNFGYMYWNMPQQLAHHTVNGCNVNIGDLMASGTISGKDEQSYGSLLEISRGGRQPLTLKDGSTRTFIEDNDTITMSGYAEKDGIRVGFGEVTAKILPAK
ncbi:MAG: fumarylacetoacetase [Bacteroidota bacterium]